MSRIGKTGTAVLTSLFLGLAAPAGAMNQHAVAPEPPQPAAPSFPACTDDRGEPVVFLNGDEHYIHPWVFYAGARYLDKDQVTGPAVFYDPDFIAGLSQIERDFTFAHECHHLRSGDARRAYQYYARTGDEAPSKADVEQMERNADCDAARRMRDEYGYSASDMATLESVIDKTISGREAVRARLAHIMTCYHAQP